ncbi:MAG: KpsF/GutQ family sugar-phosphate isomerase [Proteobacteria bacterium]|nr:KpsF/GutQ family sugar-phosphate isomerase [Pseudomonadota bacterium]
MQKECATSIFKRVLEIEKQGLDDLISHIINDSNISERFENALQALYNTKGKTIITGMGKSGHIGKKIAATLSSTGQPAFFVHPSEASHGDLGVITNDDTVLLISNSGETKELSDILHYCKRQNIVTIAISASEKSTLNKLSTYSLTIPNSKEACPMHLAPTTSTTIMMALGDAIAIILLTWRGFTHKNFHSFHPGGKLGSQLKSVKDMMHTKNLPLAFIDTDMKDCLLKMTQGGFGCVGITDINGNLLGMITDGDLRRHMNNGLLSQRAEEVMTKNPKVALENMLMLDALDEMQQFSITALFVVEDQKPIGILHIHDFLRNGII